jgi:eukaryotic-like serine/threonine-protein kinase
MAVALIGLTVIVLGSIGSSLLRKNLSTSRIPIGTFTSTQTSTLPGTSTPSYTFTPSITFTRSTTFTPTFTLTPMLPTGSTWMRPADGMLMVYVPAGEFSMGSPEGTGSGGEHPQHKVSLDAFWIDRTDVTNAMYAKCVQAGNCRLPDDTSRYDYPRYSNHPVVYVNWNQADAYCRWVGARLPTEAEWEKAARGTDGRTYPWGNDAPGCSLANYWGKDTGCVGDTSEVGSYPSGASPYGALDMAGDVWQWVADWYDHGYYSKSPVHNPTGPSSGDARVLKGGSWDYLVYFIRSAYRFFGNPESGDDIIGFRCSR